MAVIIKNHQLPLLPLHCYAEHWLLEGACFALITSPNNFSIGEISNFIPTQNNKNSLVRNHFLAKQVEVVIFLASVKFKFL